MDQPPDQKTAFDTQIGGAHYQLPVQPFRLAMTQSYDPAVFSVLRYVVRHGLKDGVQALDKAIHYVNLREQLKAENPDPTTMRQFIVLNKFRGLQATVLGRLDQYSCAEIPASVLLDALVNLKGATYGK